MPNGCKTCFARPPERSPAKRSQRFLRRSGGSEVIRPLSSYGFWFLLSTESRRIQAFRSLARPEGSCPRERLLLVSTVFVFGFSFFPFHEVGAVKLLRSFAFVRLVLTPRVCNARSSS